MAKGKVKFFNRTKMFGFITGEDGTDYFVHSNDVTGSIRDGDDVEFEPGEGERGPRATSVTRVGGSSSDDKPRGDRAPRDRY